MGRQEKQEWGSLIARNSIVKFSLREREYGFHFWKNENYLIKLTMERIIEHQNVLNYSFTAL